MVSRKIFIKSFEIKSRKSAHKEIIQIPSLLKKIEGVFACKTVNSDDIDYIGYLSIYRENDNEAILNEYYVENTMNIERDKQEVNAQPDGSNLILVFRKCPQAIGVNLRIKVYLIYS